MGRGLRIKICTALCCIMAGLGGCARSQEDKSDKTSTEYISINDIEEMQDTGKETESGTLESMGSDADTRRLEEIVYPYDCLEADDPLAQQLIEEESFFCHVPIRGLVGYSPVSEPYGGLSGYHQDREITIEKNVGKGLLQSERLAEVKENMAGMLKDILRKRGGNAADYQTYFADEAMLQQIETYLNTEINDEWVLLESFYLSDYAGNADELWWAGEDLDATRQTETDGCYNFYFTFFADCRAMGVGKDERASVIDFSCAVSKETGLIEEIGISKWDFLREEIEKGRW